MSSDMETINLLYIDLFCGAGGTSTGVESAMIDGRQCAKVIACVNHDANAIASHAANHPEALHFTEDIRTLELSPLVAHVEQYKRRYPDAKVVLWASLECTNFSKAKGGLPRDADSRTLAEHLFRYIAALEPDYIQIENVEEFMGWGDMDENGHPLSKDRGRLYLRWVNNVKKYGYRFDWRIMNAADYGAYTSRKRFFAIFAKPGLPMSFPDQTHVDRKVYNEIRQGRSLFSSADIQPWKAVREVLDLEDKGRSIFNREKPLCENTLKRIYAGLIKFVAGGERAFIVKYNSMSRKGIYHAPSVDEPCPVVATQSRLGLAQVSFLSKQFSGHPQSKNISVEGPAGTITTVDHHALVSTFLDQQYGNSKPASIGSPIGTLTTNPKFSLVSVEQTRFLFNPQFSSKGGSINAPCFTLIARMDKMPPSLVTAHIGENQKVCAGDSPMALQIKRFMDLYGLSDITMRMLKINELKRIMGFPDSYVLVGTQAEQKKYIGNAVEVTMAKVWCRELCKVLRNTFKKVA